MNSLSALLENIRKLLVLTISGLSFLSSYINVKRNYYIK